VTSSAAQVLIELVEAPGPDDRRRHARPCLHPGESDGGRRRVDFASDPDQLVDDGVISFGQRGRHSLASSGGHGRRVLAGVLSSQHGAGKGRPRRHADAEHTGHRNQVAFDRPLGQRIRDLDGRDRRPAMEACEHLRFDNFPGRRVGKTDVPHLPLRTKSSSARIVSSMGVW
jgi:hypothetical protein